MRSGDIVHYRVEKFAIADVYGDIEGRRAFISLPPKVPLRSRALRFHRGMLGDGLGALEPFSAFLTTILISRHGSAHHDARLPQPNGKACLRWRLAPGNCHTHTSRASLSDALS